jgi:hypothetical protein
MSGELLNADCSRTNPTLPVKLSIFNFQFSIPSFTHGSPG